MASRDFESEYVNILARAALIGLSNHIENEWRERCRNQYKWLMEKSETAWSRFWTSFWNDGEKVKPYTGTFDQFVEERKQWLYSKYSTTYTIWQDHIEGWLNTENLIRRIVGLSDFNKSGGQNTRLDDSEFNMLKRYAKVELI